MKQDLKVAEGTVAEGAVPPEARGDGSLERRPNLLAGAGVVQVPQVIEPGKADPGAP